MTRPLVLRVLKLADPEASIELTSSPLAPKTANSFPESVARGELFIPKARVPEMVAVLLSKLFAKIFPVTIRSPATTICPLG